MERTQPEFQRDPRIGLTLLGRYRIVRKLGEGGMGSVYEGVHELIGRKVAIKCLHAEFTKDSEVVERFKREARAATMIGNEHIIDVTDMGDLPDGAPFIAMEMLDGRELAKVIEIESPLSIGRVARIGMQVCDALGAAHDKGIVHRDLKPENIFLVRKGIGVDFVKVLDFGISKMREQADTLQGKLTRTGMTMGTPQYMAPEQAQGLATIDHRADIYALGIILYEALTGSVPFDAPTYASLVIKVMTTNAPTLLNRRADLPPDLDALVLRMLDKEPLNRPASMAEVSRALAQFRNVMDRPGWAEQPGALSSVPPPPDPDGFATTDPPPAPTPQAITGSVPNVPSVAPRPETQYELPVRKGSAAKIGLAIGAAVVLGVGGWVAFSGEDAPAAVAPEARTSPEAPPGTASPSAPAASSPATHVQEPSPAMREVRIRIAAVPADAKIFIDNVEYPNPVDAPRVRSIDPVRVRIEREGYETIDRAAVFDDNQNFNFMLQPLPAKAPPSRGRPTNTRTTENPEPPNGQKNTSKFRSDF